MKKRWCVWHKSPAIPEDQSHATSFIVEGRDLLEAVSMIDIPRPQARELLRRLRTAWTDQHGDLHEVHMTQEQ